MADSILAESHSPASNRRAIVCDEGESVWFYLTDVDGQSLVADCWLFNTIAAPLDLSGFADRDRPPPATVSFAKVGTQRPAPRADEVAITWTLDGHGACVHVEGQVKGFIDARDGHAQCVNLTQSGPFGAEFDSAVYANRFPTSEA